MISTPEQAAMYSLTQRSMAFFWALEPEARSWPLAPSHLTLDAAFVLPPVAEVSPLLSSEPHAVRTRAPETARAPSAVARSRFLR